MLPFLKNLSSITFCIVLIGIIYSCDESKKETKNIISDPKETLNTIDIPFTIAENYFIKTKENTPTQYIIHSEDELNQTLGMATTMGSKGKPSEINFDKQFVIVVTEAASSHSVELKPVSLLSSPDGKLVFSYRVLKGEELSYITQPLLAIIVSKENTGKIIFNRLVNETLSFNHLK